MKWKRKLFERETTIFPADRNRMNTFAYQHKRTEPQQQQQSSDETNCKTKGTISISMQITTIIVKKNKFITKQRVLIRREWCYTEDDFPLYVFLYWR